MPEGTIALQIPHFRERGLDLRHCHPGTLNISLAPVELEMVAPAFTFEGVAWTSIHAAETFSFSPCRIAHDRSHHNGFIYYPHPETKPGHHHPPTLVEVVAPWIDGLSPGSAVRLLVDLREVRLAEASRGDRSG